MHILSSVYLCFILSMAVERKSHWRDFLSTALKSFRLPSPLSSILGACAQAVQAGAITYQELAAMLADIRARTIEAFSLAVSEPKLTSRAALNERVSRPLAPPTLAPAVLTPPALSAIDSADLHVMRKNMNRVIDELLGSKDVVYLSEDGAHGG